MKAENPNKTLKGHTRIDPLSFVLHFDPVCIVLRTPPATYPIESHFEFHISTWSSIVNNQQRSLRIVTIMADPSARPGLLSIAVPRYPSSAGSRDLPTGERIPPNDDAGDPYNIAATRIPDAAFVQNNLDHNVKLEAIPHWPSFTCYRNASLAALFNVAPFINFLERVSRQRRIPNDMYRQLLNVCDLFRNKHGIGSREREIQYKDAVIDFWNSLDKESSLMNSTRTIRSWQAYCGDDKQSLPRSQQNLQELTAEKKKKRRHRVHDSNEFIIYLLERFIYGELDKEMVDTEV